MATEHAEKMAAAVKAVAPTLRDDGFRKQRNTFNREPEPGLVQALGFQLGEYLPGDLHGRFTVNLGLWFEEAEDPRPRFVQTMHCHLKHRIGFLLDERADTWWSVNRPDAELASLVRELTLGRALPFLDRLANREAVLAAWHGRDPDVPRHAIAPFSIAAIHAGRGETDEAERVLVRELRELGPRHPKVAGILEGAAAMGLDVRW
jgi:hypothetical protein